MALATVGEKTQAIRLTEVLQTRPSMMMHGVQRDEAKLQEKWEEIVQVTTLPVQVFLVVAVETLVEAKWVEKVEATVQTSHEQEWVPSKMAVETMAEVVVEMEVVATVRSDVVEAEA